jgi:serine/threonine protein kinase
MPTPQMQTSLTETKSDQNKQLTTSSKEAMMEKGVVLTLQERLKVPWNDITIIRQIGKGSYGKVCLGKWQHTEVAVKFCSDLGNLEEFLKEAELMM